MSLENAPLEVECLRQIGEGNYGSVYLVRIEPLKKRYAMKVLNSTQLSKKQREMVRKEIDIMSILKHPNIIRYKRAYVVREIEIHIIMEYADMGDLSGVIKDKENHQLSSVQLHDWFYQIVCGLDYIHMQKVVHRDIKPSNLLLKSSCGCVAGCNRTSVKIGDFGVSTVLRRESDYKTATSIGTPYYLSPEICQGIEYDFKSDIWSLGCVLYEMLTGRPPFLASSVEALVQKILQAQYPNLAANADPVLASLIPKLINMQPQDRPSAAFLKQLFSLRMDKRGLHFGHVNKHSAQQKASKEGGVINVNQGTRKNRRCLSAVEKSTPKVKTPKGLREVGAGNVFNFNFDNPNPPTIASNAQSPKTPKNQEQSPNHCKTPIEMRQKIDDLLTRLDENLGAELLTKCIDIYRQTKSIVELKKVLGSENIALVSTVLRLVYLEDQCFNIINQTIFNVEAVNF